MSLMPSSALPELLAGYAATPGPRRRLTWLARLSQQRSKFSARHLQFLRVSVNPLSKSGIFFRRPTPFEGCAVLALTIQFKVKSILQVGEFGLTDRRFRYRCGN